MSLILVATIAMFSLFVLYGIILSYHWFRYSLSGSMATISVIVFASGGLLFLFFLIGAAIALSS
jgi:hypothetical protein